MAAVSLSYDCFLPSCGTPSNYLPPVIIIHGYMWNKTLFADLARDISTATTRKVYTVDLRNHGSSPRAEVVRCSLMALDLKLFLEERNIPKAAFVCHSIASTAAHMFAVKNPARVEKIVMIDHPPYQYPNCDRVRRYVAVQCAAQNRCLEKLDPKLQLEEAREELMNMRPNMPIGQTMFMRKLAEDLDKIDGTFQWKIDLKFLQKAMDDTDGSFPKPPGIVYDGEILIIRGEAVWVTDSKFYQILRENPKARLVSFPKNSHLLMFENRERFVQVVAEFLNEENSSLQ